MVRIIQENNTHNKPKKPMPTAEELNQTHHALLQVLGLIVAGKPEEVRGLLENYGIDTECSDGELADELLYAISEGDADFNMDLAGLILDSSLNDDSYDSFDFKNLANKATGIFSKGRDKQGDENENKPGVLKGLVSGIGQIGGIVGIGARSLQGKSASEQTRKGITAYQEKQAEQADQKPNNNLMIVGLVVLLGFGLLAVISKLRKQEQTNLKML
jgi:hypothetical protein